MGLRTTEREKTGVRKQQTGEAVQSNLLMRESLSQLPQARLVAVFKLVLLRAFVGSDSFGRILLPDILWTFGKSDEAHHTFLFPIVIKTKESSVQDGNHCITEWFLRFVKMQLIACVLLVAISFGEGRVVLPGAKEAGLVSSEH